LETPTSMQQKLNDLKTALRVLTAYNDRRNPDQSDVEALRDYAGLPADTALEVDELACTVIHQALRLRAAAGDGRGTIVGAQGVIHSDPCVARQGSDANMKRYARFPNEEREIF
jgi:hypothetical protein